MSFTDSSKVAKESSLARLERCAAYSVVAPWTPLCALRLRLCPSGECSWSLNILCDSRSCCLFTTQEGFGRLITSGKIMHKMPQDFAFPLGLGTKKTQALHNNLGDGVTHKQTPSTGHNHNNISSKNNNNTNMRHNHNNQIHSSMADIRRDGQSSSDMNQGSASTDELSPRAPCQDLDTINL